MENITTERISPEHFDALEALFSEFAAFQQSADRMTNSARQMRDEKEYIHGFVLKDQAGVVVGYVTFFHAYYTWVGKSLYMDDLYITPQYRGQGLGSLLLGRVKEYAEEQGCKRLRWQVSDWNTSAIAFYQTMGADICSGENNCDIIL